MDFIRTTRTSSIVTALIIVLLVGCSGASEPQTPALEAPHLSSVPDPKVILVVIDGPRATEAFADPTHQHIPHLWNDLSPLGVHGENFRNMGTTVTMPGHSSMLSGTWQTIANDGSERPTAPTLFEYYRQATSAPSGDAVLVGGKSKLASCSYSTDPSYGAAYGAKVDVGFASDEETYDHLITALQTDQPHFIMVSFSYVDLKGHSGVWQDYLDQIEIADSMVFDTWNYLQSDPFYQNQTYLFLSADHGRHDDGHGGFKNHGDGCEGCRILPFLALGPNIRTHLTLGPEYAFTQRDLCKTIAGVFGIPTPEAEGVVMADIFEPVPTGVPASKTEARAP